MCPQLNGYIFTARTVFYSAFQGNDYLKQFDERLMGKFTAGGG